MTTLGDPAGRTELTIWLLAAAPAVALALIGAGAMLAGRLGVVISSVSAIALTAAMLLPIGGWVSRHDNRFPVGVDLIPPSAGSQDIYLRGEWEANARKTAEQLGLATIAIAAVAIAIVLLLDVRRRRGIVPPVPPPPPGRATANPGGGIV